MSTARTPARDDRRTPRWFFDLCSKRFGLFDVDVAANAENHLCDQWLGPGGSHEDALSATSWWPWSSPQEGSTLDAWCNPPYGPPGTIPKWIQKARQQRDQHGTRTLMLLSADTSARWFHDVARSELIELVPFRLAFKNGSPSGRDTARFASVLVWIAPRLAKPASKGSK